MVGGATGPLGDVVFEFTSDDVLTSMSTQPIE